MCVKRIKPKVNLESWFFGGYYYLQYFYVL